MEKLLAQAQQLVADLLATKKEALDKIAQLDAKDLSLENK